MLFHRIFNRVECEGFHPIGAGPNISWVEETHQLALLLHPRVDRRWRGQCSTYSH